jgi:hypothetical protein
MGSLKKINKNSGQLGKSHRHHGDIYREICCEASMLSKVHAPVLDSVKKMGRINFLLH